MAQIPVHVSPLAISSIRRVLTSCNKFTQLQMTQTSRPPLIAVKMLIVSLQYLLAINDKLKRGNLNEKLIILLHSISPAVLR